MDSLKDKLLKLKESLTKGMNNSGIGGKGSVKLGAVLPSLKAVTTAGKKTGNNSSTKSTGISQPSKVNPIKSAQQTHNPDIKDIKMKEAQIALKINKNEQEFIKFDKSGQWSLNKMKDRETSVKGVSELGIEARRATGKPSSETGYVRVTSPESHKKVAREIARKNLEETKSIKPKLNKSGYKGYTETDNIKRKKNNMSENTGISSMNRIKQYGGSGPNAAAKEAAEMKRKSKRNPVKVFSAEEIAAENAKRNKE